MHPGERDVQGGGKRTLGKNRVIKPRSCFSDARDGSRESCMAAGPVSL